MTKKKANAGPKGFQPGNQAAVKEKPLIKTHVTIDPDQLTWLRTQPDGISPTVRQAIDLLISTQVPAASSRDGK